ncbi:hypothetical protein K458DRAFT_262437, partial [Lentithecium fluviatile CBS 122367]
MKPMFKSDDVKGSFFLATLPDTINNVINNLSIRSVTAFKDIEPKILNISEKHSLDVADSAAYAANMRSASHQPPGGQRQECTWCRKHQLTFIGHVYTNCNELRKHKEQQQQKKPQGGSTSARNRNTGGGKRHKDNSVETESAAADSDSGNEVVGFTTVVDLTSPPPTPSPPRRDGQRPSTSRINKNGKRIRDDNDVSAFVAIQPSALDAPVWLFDTGASRHMSGCVDDFVSLSPKTEGTITVAGGIKLPIQGVGTIRIRCRLPNDSTTIAELTNVLYSSELYNTRLFSWSYVREHGYKLHAAREDLYLSRNGKYALWAKHVKGVIQIQT